MVAVASSIAALFVGLGVAWAHSGLAAASPGPGAIVGGEIDRIEIFYGDIITAFDGTITLQTTGETLPSTSELTSDIAGTIFLDQPLSENGEYAVRHTITSLDSDVVEATYLFTFETSAAPPQFVFVEEEEENTSPPVLWIVLGVGLVVIAVLSLRLIVALRRRNRAAATDLA